MAVDEEHMAALHEQWMDEPGPTDVLAFPMDELRPGRDDERARGRACSATSCSARRSPSGRPRAAGHATDDELELLTTHGILHLLGYDHAEPEEEREMFGLQRPSCCAAWRGRPVTGDRRTGRPDCDSCWPPSCVVLAGVCSPRPTPRSRGVPGPRRGAASTRAGAASRRARARVVDDRGALHQRRAAAARARARPPPSCSSPSCSSLAATAAGWPACSRAVVMLVCRSCSSASAPRTLGRQHADRVARWPPRALTGCAAVLGPVAALLILVGNAITPGRGFRDGPFATEAELRELVDLAEEPAVSRTASGR